MASKKDARKKADMAISDKTFGLKNKSKSKKVQNFVQQTHKQIKGELDAQSERLKAEKKNAKLAKMQADEELRMLFSAAVGPESKSKAAEKSKQAKAKEQEAELKKTVVEKDTLLKDYPFIADEMLAMTGMLSDLTPEELDAELDTFLKTGISEKLTLEQVIELQRAKMRSAGNMGTPVTEVTLAKWKADRAARRALVAKDKVEAEMRKKKGGKGLSVLSGRELFIYNQSLFVDDEDADNDEYERHSDAEDDEEDEEGHGCSGLGGDDYLGAEDTSSVGDTSRGAAEAGEATKVEAASEQVAVALQESLYLDGSDDDFDDLDDDDDE
mmetsp:Transcript_22885/g.42042  ORF Transcript_22885/g.42042 Transcript_22885/m.42042 type:complete len:327 (+) Transcript_22885:76-1056(+)